MDDNDFAAHMRDHRDAATRTAALADGALVQAWSVLYSSLYAQLGGEPDVIGRDAGGCRMHWGDVMFDVGLVYTALQRPTRRAAVLELVRQHDLWISAPGRAYSFVVGVPSGEDFAMFRSMEGWARGQGLPTLCAVADPQLSHIILFVRSYKPWVACGGGGAIMVQIP